VSHPVRISAAENTPSAAYTGAIKIRFILI